MRRCDEKCRSHNRPNFCFWIPIDAPGRLWATSLRALFHQMDSHRLLSGMALRDHMMRYRAQKSTHDFIVSSTDSISTLLALGRRLTGA